MTKPDKSYRIFQLDNNEGIELAENCEQDKWKIEAVAAYPLNTYWNGRDPIYTFESALSP